MVEQISPRAAFSRIARRLQKSGTSHSSGRAHFSAMLAAAFALLAAGSATPASAALGQASSSVEMDRAHLSARLSSRHLAGYTAHTLTAPNGGVVSEYVNAAGVVFAVSWRGHGRPDLRQILGEHFATFQADTVRTTEARTKAPPRVDRPDLVVHASGHPGAFWGHALLPAAVPAGFSGAEFQ